MEHEMSGATYPCVVFLATEFVEFATANKKT